MNPELARYIKSHINCEDILTKYVQPLVIIEMKKKLQGKGPKLERSRF